MVKIGLRVYCKDMTYRVYDKDTNLESTVRIALRV